MTEEEREKRLLELIRERNIEDWHNFWSTDTPLSERRPDLIDPVTCARFGISEETWPAAGINGDVAA